VVVCMSMSLPRASTTVFLLLGCLLAPVALAASDAPVRPGRASWLAQREPAANIAMGPASGPTRESAARVLAGAPGADRTRHTGMTPGPALKGVRAGAVVAQEQTQAAQTAAAPPEPPALDAAMAQEGPRATEMAAAPPEPPSASEGGTRVPGMSEVPASSREGGTRVPGMSEVPASSREGGTRLPGMSDVPAQANSEDLPLSTGAWVAHGGLTLLPLGGLWAASRVGGDTRLTATASEAAVGMLLGSLSARLLFFRPEAPSEGRWMELEVASFGAGLVLTPPLAALGTWGLGELAFGGSRDRGNAYLGALGGAAVGTLLGLVVHGALTKLAGPSTRLKSGRQLLGLAFIGAGATVGYQWAGGGRRTDERTR
jgi:hypothetical protein